MPLSNSNRDIVPPQSLIFNQPFKIRQLNMIEAAM